MRHSVGKYACALAFGFSLAAVAAFAAQGGKGGAGGGKQGGGPGGGRPHPLFMVFDADRNGAITETEVAAVLATMKQLDANGDGQLTPQECAGAGQGQPGQGGAQGPPGQAGAQPNGFRPPPPMNGGNGFGGKGGAGAGQGGGGARGGKR
jgi:hypothetical protein